MSSPAPRVFDEKHYVELIEARGETIRKIVPELGKALQLSTALDAGCGLGFFGQILNECRLEVLGVDGRQTNVDEARRRYPKVRFEKEDIEDSKVTGLGSFDLVLCFGLLYHLENPLRAIRHLRALTGKVLLLESMCLPSNEPFALLREEHPLDDQSLTNLAFYPSEGCIVKMLYGSGFTSVYRVSPLPEHDEFQETATGARRRTILLAGFRDISLPGLIPLAEPREARDPWALETPIVRRMKRFLRKPIKEKLESVTFRWNSLFPPRSEFIDLPFGARWCAENSSLDSQLRAGAFEPAETNFARRFLQNGMTVLDIGAHHGFYTLLASKRVGSSGKVVAFEPSPRERTRLERHVHLNDCMNVTIEPFAVGAARGRENLFVVEGSDDYCNSLRAPAGEVVTTPVPVEVISIDEYIGQTGMAVNFLKIDVEGAELDVLRGGRQLLSGTKRPVVLAEVYDLRTKEWGYRAREIVGFLSQLGYEWFEVGVDGLLQPISSELESYDANLVAVPRERAEQIREELREK